MKAQARQLSLESRKLDIFVENSSFYMADLARECMNEVQCLNLKKKSNYKYIRSAWKGRSTWFRLLIPLHQIIRIFECPEYRGLQPLWKLKNLQDTIALKMAEESFSRICEADSGYITYIWMILAFDYFGMRKGKQMHCKLFRVSWNSAFYLFLMFCKFLIVPSREFKTISLW